MNWIEYAVRKPEPEPKRQIFLHYTDNRYDVIDSRFQPWAWNGEVTHWAEIEGPGMNSKNEPESHQTYTVGDVIRMKHYPTSGGYRVWKVFGVHLGATYQEGTYRLMPLDLSDNQPIHVPCIMLETHAGIERL